MYVDVTLFVETPFFLSSMQDSSMSLPTKKKINSIFQLKVYLLKTTFQLKVHLLCSTPCLKILNSNFFSHFPLFHSLVWKSKRAVFYVTLLYFTFIYSFHISTPFFFSRCYSFSYVKTQNANRYFFSNYLIPIHSPFIIFFYL